MCLEKVCRWLLVWFPNTLSSTRKQGHGNKRRYRHDTQARDESSHGSITMRLEWTLQVDVYIYMIIQLFANTASSLDPVCKCNPELVYGLSPDL